MPSAYLFYLTFRDGKYLTRLTHFSHMSQFLANDRPLTNSSMYSNYILCTRVLDPVILILMSISMNA